MSTGPPVRVAIWMVRLEPSEGAEAVPVAPGQAHLVEQAGAIRGNNCVMRLRLYASAPFSATLRPYQYHRRQRHAPKTGLRHSWL